MRYDLPAMTRRAGNRRSTVILAPIRATKAQSTSLSAIYRRMLAPWLTSRDAILAAYGRELARVLATDAIDDLAALFASLAEEVSRLVLTLTPDLRDWAFRVEQVHRGKWAGTVLSGTGVDIRHLVGPQDVAETVEAFLARNVALVKDISAQAQGRISDAVFRGIQQRAPVRDVAKAIADAIGMGRKRALRIAADQSTKLSAALSEQRQREAGLEVYRYVHSGKLHPRPWHEKRDGKLYEIDTGKEVRFEEGEKVYGSDRIERDDKPSVPPFCACTTRAVVVFEGEVL
jgi:hypothetical protein